MPPFSALILQDPGIQRAMAASSMRQLGYAQVLEMSDNTLALAQLREAGDTTLLLCDLRIAPAARLAVVQAAAREQRVRGVLLIGEPFPGIWPALSKLLCLQGVPARRLDSGPVTQEHLLESLRNFDLLQTMGPVQPTVSELPAKREVISALGRGEMRAALQPKVSVHTGVICGFEVLVRWQRPDGEVLAPCSFLPTLREHGLLDALLFEMLEQAVGRLHSTLCDRLELSFNLEPTQLAQPDFGARVQQQLLHLGVAPERITFELTEMSRLETPAISLDNLLQLRLLGCGLAIDDFGSGQSTLQRLLELPFTELKLDASFLVGLEDPRRQAVLASALALGRALDIPVVAEGVETESQLRHLERLGCERAQGFLLGRPMMESELANLLQGLSDET